MENTTIIDKLSLFGLTRQEATLYFCLLRNDELTGYEVAKLTGISRSNVYNGLAALVEHGAAYICEGTTNKYVAVPMEEFCDNYIRYLQGAVVYLELHKPKRATNAEGYLTIEGEQHIKDKIHHLLLGTQMRIYFSANSVLLDSWKEEIKDLAEQNKKIVLISDEKPKMLMEETCLKDVIFYQNVWDAEQKKQIRLIIDSTYVLTGEWSEGEDKACLYSAQKNFVAVFKEAMHNEIELIKLRKTTD